MIATHIVLIIALVLFPIIAWRSALGIKSYNDFFHVKDRTGGNVSAIFANVTLGTGLVYLTTTYQQLGAWSLLLIVGGLSGYLFISWLSTKIEPFTSDMPNFYSLLGKVTTPINGIRYSACIVVIVALTFVLLLSYELALSSKFLYALLFGSTDSMKVFLFSGILFMFISGYTVVGGIRGVYKTDKWQAVIIVVAIVAFIASIINMDSQWEQNFITATIKPFPKALTTLLIIQVFLGFATQIYSVVNWGVASNRDGQSNKDNFKIIGCGVLFASAIMLLLGGLIAPSSSHDPITVVMTQLSLATSWSLNSILAPFILLGFLAILLTTIDTLIIFVSMIVIDEFSQEKNSRDAGDEGLLKIRIKIFFFMLVPYLISAYATFIKPDIVQSLLVVTTSLSILSPFFVVLVLRSDRDVLSRTNNNLIFSSLFIFAITFGISLYKLTKGQDTSMVVIYGVIASSAVAALVFATSKEKVASK